MQKLDIIDLKILDLLQQNSRLKTKELAEKINLSTTPTFERVKKMERSGIIQRYVAIVDAEKLGIKLSAFAEISLKDHSKKAIKDFVDQVVKFPEVTECHYVTGGYDFMLKVMVHDIKAYNHFVLDKLAEVPNIGKVASALSLSVEKYTNMIPLAHKANISQDITG